MTKKVQFDLQQIYWCCRVWCSMASAQGVLRAAASHNTDKCLLAYIYRAERRTQKPSVDQLKQKCDLNFYSTLEDKWSWLGKSPSHTTTRQWDDLLKLVKANANWTDCQGTLTAPRPDTGQGSNKNKRMTCRQANYHVIVSAVWLPLILIMQRWHTLVTRVQWALMALVPTTATRASSHRMKW